MVTQQPEPRADARSLSFTVFPAVAVLEVPEHCQWARMVETAQPCALAPDVALNGCWLCLGHFDEALAEIGAALRAIRDALDGS